MSEIEHLVYPWSESQWQQLCQQADDGRLPHALLFEGPDGCGLEDFALSFSARLICEAPTPSPQSKACGVCQRCKLLNIENSPNFKQVVPEVNDKGVQSKVIKVDQIREVIEFVNHTSMQGGRRVILISPAEAMNPNAANAVLKSLEEPANDVFFILVVHQKARLLATIRSRCQSMDFQQPEKQMALGWLSDHIADEKERGRLLALSGGSPLLALQWYEEEKSEEISGLIVLLKQVMAGEEGPVSAASALMDYGMQNVVPWWWRWLMLEARQQVTTTAGSGFLKQAGLANKQVLDFMQQLTRVNGQLQSSANPNEQLLAESLLIDWQGLTRQ